MNKFSCFYNCGAVESSSFKMEEHYRKFHTKFKPYQVPEFTCDNCHQTYERSLLFSPAKNQAQLRKSPHYCGKCVNSLQSQPTKSPLKPKIMNKTKLKPKKRVKSKKSIKTTALKPIQRKIIKNPLEYYQYMKSCCLKGQKISKTAHECRTNALVINKQMSASKKKAVQKIRTGYRQMGAGLAEFIKANK